MIRMVDLYGQYLSVKDEIDAAMGEVMRDCSFVRGPQTALLEEELLKQLAGLIGEEGEVESTRFDAQVEGGALQVTLTAECREEIGREQPGVQQLPQPPEEPGSGN